MPRPLRLSLVALGLALAIYGTASLTGGWLGTPPWWDVPPRWMLNDARGASVPTEVYARDDDEFN